MERLNRIHKHYLWYVLGGFVFLFSTTLSFAGDLVSGQYITVTPSEIEFIVTVGQPAPSHLIVQHFHPSGSTFVKSSPDVAKLNQKKHFAKWLMKDVQPGSYNFSATFRGRDVSGFRLVLRYKDPSGGSFRETVVTPEK